MLIDHGVIGSLVIAPGTLDIVQHPSDSLQVNTWRWCLCPDKTLRPHPKTRWKIRSTFDSNRVESKTRSISAAPNALRISASLSTFSLNVPPSSHTLIASRWTHR